MGISSVLAKYVRDQHGQFGVWLGLLSLPLVAVTTFAVDYNKSIAQSSKVSGALDSAALAAVTYQGIDEDGRAAYAEDFFWNIIPKSENIQLNVELANSEKVVLSALATTPLSIVPSSKLTDLTSNDKAVAVLTKGDVVCALALDPEGKNAFEVIQGGTFFSPTCSVQVNSTHATAATVSGGGSAIANDFCVSGGASGFFAPHVNTQCSVVADPYKSVIPPVAGPCIDQADIDAVLGHWHAVTSAYGVTLSPGTYCGGLTFRSNIVTLAPGNYFIKDGPLILDAGSIIQGEDVAFILSGNNATASVINGSSLDMSAPKTGPLAGLAIYKQSAGPEPSSATNGDSTFLGGANLKIVGTVYLPEQKITFLGGSSLVSNAPATSFIAHRISIKQGAIVAVAVDHRAAGLPPLLPRSDESARLLE